MKIRTKQFRVGPGDDVDLKKWPTKIDAIYDGKDGYKALLDEQVKDLSDLQQKLFATRRHARAECRRHRLAHGAGLAGQRQRAQGDRRIGWGPATARSE